MASTLSLTSAAGRMAAAALAFIDSLDADQRSRACAPFASPDRTEFTYVPGPRPGLSLSEMSAEQQGKAMALLTTGLSGRGLADARAIMRLEDLLAGIERTAGKPGWERRHPEYYWFRILGQPDSSKPWSWKVGGHHVVVNVTVVGERIAGTPQFFGANPATVPSGFPESGMRTLADEEDLGRALVSGLTATQREAAVTGPTAPPDILSRRDPLVDASGIPPGLLAGDMHDEARNMLVRLVRRYLGRLIPEVADRAWADIEQAGLDRMSFRWAGPTERGPGNGHYYAVLGPTFLLEYDNTQNDANHIHSVWRDLRNDWGEDLLAAHYAAHRH